MHAQHAVSLPGLGGVLIGLVWCAAAAAVSCLLSMRLKGNGKKESGEQGVVGLNKYQLKSPYLILAP